MPAGLRATTVSASYYHSNTVLELTLGFLTVAPEGNLPEPSPSMAPVPVIS
jgi:hypothetical protein